MASAELKKILDADPKLFFEVISGFEDYPEFVEGCTQAKTLKKTKNGCQVAYKVSLIKEITYTLNHVLEPEKGILSWSLVESDFFKKNEGRWEIAPQGKNQTQALYQVELEFKIPVPGLILNRIIKSGLPTLLQNFEKRAKSLENRRVP